MQKMQKEATMKTKIRQATKFLAVCFIANLLV